MNAVGDSLRLIFAVRRLRSDLFARIFHAVGMSAQPIHAFLSHGGGVGPAFQRRRKRETRPAASDQLTLGSSIRGATAWSQETQSPDIGSISRVTLKDPK